MPNSLLYSKEKVCTYRYIISEEEISLEATKVTDTDIGSWSAQEKVGT